MVMGVSYNLWVVLDSYGWWWVVMGLCTCTRAQCMSVWVFCKYHILMCGVFIIASGVFCIDDHVSNEWFFPFNSILQRKMLLKIMSQRYDQCDYWEPSHVHSVIIMFFLWFFLQLYHLLYWRDVAPASALIYFTKPFSANAITAQYANKAMQRFQPVRFLSSLYIYAFPLRHLA